MRIAFIYAHKYPQLWRDGLYMAIRLLSKLHKVDWINLYNEGNLDCSYDLYLGWGAVNSPADVFIRNNNLKPAMLFVAGCNFDEKVFDYYDNLFVETTWAFDNIEKKEKIRAFGYNDKIYNNKFYNRTIDYIYPACFASWKRHDLFVKNTEGSRLAIGEMQENDRQCVDVCKENGIIVLDMMSAKILSLFYNSSRNVYIPAEIMGGGERAVLEGVACGCNVVVENEKLKGLLEKARKNLKRFGSYKYYLKIKNAIKRYYPTLSS